MDLGIKDKVAFVTGGTHGIGKAIALALAAEGCSVCVCSRNQERVTDTVAELKAAGVRAAGFQCDVLNPGEIEATAHAALTQFPQIQILVNNVGGGGRWGSDNVETTAENVWMEVYAKNALAAVRFSRLMLPTMRKTGWGRIVTISSIYGKEGGGRPWFNMAKAAEISLMKSLALRKDLVRDGVTFNTVAPGSIMIEGTAWEEELEKDHAKFARGLDENFPLGRMGTPEEVAALVVFLCSKRASLINGACIVADGGETKSF